MFEPKGIIKIKKINELLELELIDQGVKTSSRIRRSNLYTNLRI
jgi:hypothetical protein